MAFAVFFRKQIKTGLAGSKCERGSRNDGEQSRGNGDAMSEGGRPRRGAARRSRLGSSAGGLPSAVHYVGYVEDEETPEMIMKKFEALERVKQAALDKKREAEAAEAEAAEEGVPPDAKVVEGGEEKAAGGTGTLAGEEKAAPEGGNNLDESDLLELFKQTSMFSVKSAQANNELMMMGEEEFWDDDDINASDFELDEDEFWGDGGSRRRRRGHGGTRASRGDGHARRTVTVLNRMETGVYVRRKVRVVDETLPQLMRVPNAPVPLSWCRTVRPYSKRVALPEPPKYTMVHEECIADMDFSALRGREGSPFLGVLINPSWVVDVDDADARLECLRSVPLKKLCPTGFVFIWTDKRDVQRVCDLMYSQNYCYVENLTWVHMLANNKMARDAYVYTRKSHSTLYIFRKQNEGRDIELRHQRNPDVVLDCVRSAKTGHGKIPSEAYKAIETLLPCHEGRLLELWSTPEEPRNGWTHVVEAL